MRGLLPAGIVLRCESLCIHCKMHLVRERSVLACHDKCRVVSDRFAQRFNPRHFALGEIRQDVMMHQVLDAGMPDARRAHRMPLDLVDAVLKTQSSAPKAGKREDGEAVVAAYSPTTV